MGHMGHTTASMMKYFLCFVVIGVGAGGVWQQQRVAVLRGKEVTHAESGSEGQGDEQDWGP